MKQYQFCYWGPTTRSGSRRPDHFEAQIADLLAQCVAVEAQEIGGADLVTPGRSERRGDQWRFDLAQHPGVEPGGRELLAEAHEIVGEKALDRLRQVAGGLGGVREGSPGSRGELVLHQLDADDVLRINCR